MRKLFFVLTAFFLIPVASCDDGDIIDFELDFDETFKACETDVLVFYKTKNDPSESLSLIVTSLNLDDIFEVDEETGIYENTVTINTTNTFNYRTYSNTTLPNDLFCNAVPNSEIKITSDIESTSGSAIIKTILTEDDNDGVPAELEFDGDTDGDGLPNYIDADDDGDNVLTKDENPDPNNDGDLSDAQDTDGDGIPDYLDDDDDGDGVKTRDEENDSPDLNPGNDTTNTEVGADYLNPAIKDTVPAKAYREHTILRSFIVNLTITNIDLRVVSQDILDFGVLESSAIPNEYTSRKTTPEFN